MANNITASTTSSRISVATGDGKTKVITATPIAINGAAGPPGASGDVASQITLNETKGIIDDSYALLRTLATEGIDGGTWA